MEGGGGGGGSQEVPVKRRLPCLGLALGTRLGGKMRCLLVGVSFCWVSCRSCSFSLGQTCPVKRSGRSHSMCILDDGDIGG